MVILLTFLCLMKSFWKMRKITILPELVILLQQVSASFHGYFSLGDIGKEPIWILDPFLFDLNSIDDGNLIKDYLIEIWANARIQKEFEKLDLEQFWFAYLEPFPQLAKATLQALLPFATSYLCEMGFSYKNKNQKWLKGK